MAYQNNSIPLSVLVELAQRAKLQNEDWVQRSLVALAVSNDPVLANALLMRLQLKALVETLDPFPFDTPSEEDFFQ